MGEGTACTTSLNGWPETPLTPPLILAGQAGTGQAKRFGFGFLTGAPGG